MPHAHAQVAYSKDFTGLAKDDALRDLHHRIAHYEKIYQTVREEEGAYIKMFDLRAKVRHRERVPLVRLAAHAGHVTIVYTCICAAISAVSPLRCMHATCTVAWPSRCCPSCSRSTRSPGPSS